MIIKPGKQIEIYDDPVTRKRLEGVAIVKKINGIDNDFIYLTVKFPTDIIADRKIYIGS